MQYEEPDKVIHMLLSRIRSCLNETDLNRAANFALSNPVLTAFEQPEVEVQLWRAVAGMMHGIARFLCWHRLFVNYVGYALHAPCDR